MKPSSPTHAVGAHIGEEEKNGKQKKEEKYINRERASNPATLDNLVASCDPHGSYGGFNLKTLTSCKTKY